jgi:hypothetical protein
MANGTIYKPQGNFVYNRYVHSYSVDTIPFYSIDTIPSYPVRSLRPLRLFHTTKCLSEYIKGLQSVLSLSFIALGTPRNF